MAYLINDNCNMFFIDTYEIFGQQKYSKCFKSRKSVSIVSSKIMLLRDDSVGQYLISSFLQDENNNFVIIFSNGESLSIRDKFIDELGSDLLNLGYERYRFNSKNLTLGKLEWDKRESNKLGPDIIMINASLKNNIAKHQKSILQKEREYMNPPFQMSEVYEHFEMAYYKIHNYFCDMGKAW